MRARLAALALVAAAAALHLLVTVPRQRQAGIDGEEYRRLRDERRAAQSRLARLDRADALRRQAGAVFAGSGPEELVRSVRRSVIQSLQGANVSEVRLAVRPGGREVATNVSLTASGSFQDVVRAASHVARGGSGLLLRAVSFAPGTTGVGLTVDAVSVESGS
jgi:hypothetical protein